jgi:dipeptidyl-peptidase 4
MLQRYSRAARLTAPKIASQSPGLEIGGYWLDERCFYFLAERFEPAIEQIVTTPSLADTATRSIEAVIPPEELAALLLQHSGTKTDLPALSSATFDMPDRHTLGVSVAGVDYLIDLRRRVVVSAHNSLEMPALYSPDGGFACFVRGHDLWLKDRKSGIERPLSRDGEAHNGYGQQPESGLSAVAYRQRPAPMGLWSADSQWLLTHRIDERALADLALIEHVPRDGARPRLHQYKYPMPGDPMPIVTYVAIHVASGRKVEFADFPATPWAVSPFAQRRAWFGGSNKAWFVRLDRYCRQADLVCLDLASGEGRLVLSERVETGYIDLNPAIAASPNVRALERTDEVIWYSERDGWGHLYLYDAATGRCQNPITRGSWQVRTLVEVDQIARKVWFLAGGIDAEADPAHRTLCAVNFDGSGFEVLLHHEGDIFIPGNAPCGPDQDRPFRPSAARAGLAPGRDFAVVRYGSVNQGNRTEIVHLGPKQNFSIASVQPSLGDVTPRPFTALAADGKTRLHGVMFLPSDFAASTQYPLVDYIYPGPQAAWQPQSYRSLHAAPAASLAELGFVTIMLNTRGTPLGSRAFRQAGYGELLEPQLADHAAVVRQLAERHAFIDGSRVGIFGYSGGGFAAARALFDYGELFKVGVAACGNHDNRFNTACWAEKYCGPGADLASQANTKVAHRLNGKLLLISGDMDENVHVSETLRLAAALIEANRDFDLLIVPNAGHDVLFGAYAQRRMWDYFVRHLLAKEPPKEFRLRFAEHELLRMGIVSMREFRSRG